MEVLGRIGQGETEGQEVRQEAVVVEEAKVQVMVRILVALAVTAKLEYFHGRR
jgi:hypothetical protein|tara:strand:- start:1387 stop:1545 length:159 start_codon:yes stop_codon:yes gene_type:complete